jgi:hypothetical protein
MGLVSLRAKTDEKQLRLYDVEGLESVENIVLFILIFASLYENNGFMNNRR